MTIKKPQLAEDAILEDVRFPCWVQPKIDGVRAMNLYGRLTGRSLDEFKGFAISNYFSRPEFVGLDGPDPMLDLAQLVDADARHFRQGLLANADSLACRR